MAVKILSSAWFADLALLSITVLWGVTFVTVQDALNFTDTFTFMFLRFGAAAIVMALWVRGGLFSKALWGRGLLLGTLLYGGYVCQTWGLTRITPSRSAFITGLCVVLVPFATFVLFKKKPSWPALLGASLAALGMWLLTGGAGGGRISIGDVVTLGCAIEYALHIALTGKWAKDFNPISLVAVQMCVVTAWALVTRPFVDTHVTWNMTLVSAMIICGVLASAVAISIQTWAQVRTAEVRAALIFSLEPVFACAWSAYLGREVFHSMELVGGGVIILGVIVGEVGMYWKTKMQSSASPTVEVA